jgi:glycosyltransferase involved in cell wall biosynthesis
VSRDFKASWSVVVMCFNEAPTLRGIVTECERVLAALTDDYEIVIIDDASSDGSREIAGALAAESAHVRAVCHERNRGVGEVLRAAYREGSKEWLSVIPADGEFPPAELAAGAARMESGALVAFSLTKLPPAGRRAVSAIQRALNRLLFGLRVERVNWVKILPAAEVRALPLVSRSPLVETEVLVRLRTAGWRIIEVPSRNELHLGRAGGLKKLRFARAALAAFGETIRLWWALR